MAQKLLIAEQIFKTLKMQKLISLNLIGVCIVFLAANSNAQNAKAHLTGHKTLPNVNVKDLSNKTVNIADYGKNGKITVVSFWATWCSPCKKELNNIAEFYEEWQEDYNMELVAVSIDDSRNTSKVKTYINGQQWEYEVLLDPNSSLKRALNFQTVPYTIWKPLW